MIIRDNHYNVTIDTEDYKAIWYAVQDTPGDAWDYGSTDYDEAVEMLQRQGHGLIVVIDDERKVALAGIDYDDLF